MKSLLALAALLAPLVSAHYTIPDFIYDGVTSSDWEYTRETANHYSNGPVTDVNSTAFRCYENDDTVAGNTQTITVTAGSTVGVQGGLNGAFYHPGFFSAYLSPAVPAANSNSAGTGQTWFKIWQWDPTVSNGALVFPSQSIDSVSFPIPKNVPSGQYLLRVEQGALHVASTYGGAQFYLSCTQLNIVGGGSGTPGPLVSIPGVYTGYEPGILLNIYNIPPGFVYQPPGPPVWTG